MPLHNVRQSILTRAAHQAVPQSVTFELKELAAIKQVGFFLHGENNMNPKRTAQRGFFSDTEADIEIWLSKDDADWKKVVDEELEHRAGDFLYDLGAALENFPRAKFARFVIVRETISCRKLIFVLQTENFGGSGIHLSKAYVFGYLGSDLEKAGKTM